MVSQKKFHGLETLCNFVSKMVVESNGFKDFYGPFWGIQIWKNIKHYNIERYKYYLSFIKIKYDDREIVGF